LASPRTQTKKQLSSRTEAACFTNPIYVIGQPAVIPEGLDPVALRPCFSACLPKYLYVNIFTRFPQIVNRFFLFQWAFFL